MLVVITYDVDTTDREGQRRLRRIARLCEDHGQRVQFSVFECELDPATWVKLKNKLLREMNANADSLRFYFLGSESRRRIEHVGVKKEHDLEGPLIL